MQTTSNQEILEKAIQKAIDGGWRPDKYYGWGISPLTTQDVISHYDCDWRTDPECVREFIFNHDFAKALWGTEKVCFACGGNDQNQRWCDFCKSLKENRLMPKFIFHLKQMVGAEDPIKYLGENI